MRVEYPFTSNCVEKYPYVLDVNLLKVISFVAYQLYHNWFQLYSGISVMSVVYRIYSWTINVNETVLYLELFHFALPFLNSVMTMHWTLSSASVINSGIQTARFSPTVEQHCWNTIKESIDSNTGMKNCITLLKCTVHGNN